MREYWLERNVFITGATGMIGAFLVRGLVERGSNVTVLIQDLDMRSDLCRNGNIERVAVVNGSLEDFSALERAINRYEISTVIHLGAQTIVGVAHRFPLATFESNIRGTYNLLEACRMHSRSNIGVVIASSDKAYGEQPTLPYTEDMPLCGRHPYEVSKRCTDMLGQSYHHTYGLPVAIARCGNVYGGNDLNFSRIIPGTIRSLLLSEAPVIRSDGTYVRDYVYVKDVVDAYLLLAENVDDKDVAGEAFNFSTEKPLTVFEIVETIQRLMSMEHLKPLVLNNTEGEIKSQYLDAGKAKRVLGWQPRYDLEEGLRETIAWYKGHFKALEQ